MKSKNGKTKVVEVNRSILSALNSYSLKSGVVVYFQEALQYRLCSVPLSLCHTDGTRCHTTKSKLKDTLLVCVQIKEKEVSSVSLIDSILLVDTMALIHTMVKIQSTYFDLANKFISLIPKSYRQVDIIADNYNDNEHSIKRGERMNRGESNGLKLHLCRQKFLLISEFSIMLRRKHTNAFKHSNA